MNVTLCLKKLNHEPNHSVKWHDKAESDPSQSPEHTFLGTMP